MSDLSERKKEIEEQRRGSWVKKLLKSSGGGVDSAARLDLAIDGNLWHLDLRRAPFAGNEELKELARAAQKANEDFRGALINIVWNQEVPDE